MSARLVAVAQFAPMSDRAANLETIERLVTAAVDRGAGLVVLPEYSSWFTPEMGPAWRAEGESLHGPFVTALAALADAQQVHLVAGMIESAHTTARVRNTLVAIAPGRGLVARYRKLHLYDAFGARESDWIEAGAVEAPELFDWDGVRVGMQTCYDVRFPEVSRRLVDAGAQLLVVPAEWVRGPLKEQHWRTLVTARAIENTVYLAAADHIPPVGVGTSLIIDPMGVAIAELGEQEGIAVGPIELERMDAVRRTNPALALRRFRVVEPGTD